MNSQQRFYLKELNKRLEIAKSVIEQVTSEVKGVQNDEGDKFDSSHNEDFQEGAEQFAAAVSFGVKAAEAIQEMIDSIEKGAN